jgi:hypothetical protein
MAVPTEIRQRAIALLEQLPGESLVNFYSLQRFDPQLIIIVLLQPS